MKVAIMQPYLFPYIGYWQLINAVNQFVILDDVNYIKQGFINRNYILLNGQSHMFSIPICQASQNRLIMDTKLNFSPKEKMKFIKTIEFAYKKAPYFLDVFPIIRDIIGNDESNLTKYILNSILKINKYLGIKTDICISSQLKKDNCLKGEERIKEICKCVGADIYINPSGGRMLYHSELFQEDNIKLFFLDPKMDQIRYYQNQENFESSLSIIDILMFNGKDEIKKMLGEYSLNAQ